MYSYANRLWILSILTLFACSHKDSLRHTELLDKHKYPSDHMFLQRAYPSGKIDMEEYRKEVTRVQSMKNHPTDSRQGSWKNEGPVNIGGRIVDLEGSGTTLFACTASGGIFKTDDKGQSWTAIFDNEATLSIGDMAISKTDSDVMYVGTGEANAGGGSLAYDGEGMYKTINGGNNWTRIGLEDVGSIGRVAIDPNDDNIVFVAAMGTLFSENSERGIFRTLDGGQSWEKVLYSTPKTGGIDVLIDPNNSQTIYAAMWERERLLFDRTYGGPTSGIFKSVDGGDTWIELKNGLPSIDKGRIGIAISPSNPEILYCTIAAVEGPLLGLYKTENAGASWSKLPTDNIQVVSFMWWFGRIKVDPQNPDIVYHIGFRMDKSIDGGLTWNRTFDGVHVDQHEIWINPNNTEEVYVGNDGGVYYSNSGGSGFSKIDNIPITQFYRCAIDYLQPDRLYGGTQDNSTMRTLTGAENDYEIINGGDGFTVLIDPTDNNYVYVTSQYGNMRRSTDGGNSFQSGTIGISNSEPNNWNTPFVLDPNNPEIIYYGTSHLYRSEDRAVTWTRISHDLSNGPYVGINPFGTITSISVSPFDAQQILVGTDDGNVWLTNNLGNTWENISTSLPNRWVTSVCHHPDIANHFFVTFSGYRFGENNGYVYEMSDFNQGWEDISEGLPQVPVNDILIIPNTNEKIVATDVGVFIAEKDAEWELLSVGLPIVITTDLDYHDIEDKLLVATYGRSLYSYTFDRAVNVDDQELNQAYEFYPNPAASRIKFKANKNRKIQEVRITSENGQTLKRLSGKILMQSEIDIDVSSLSPGKYVLILDFENGSRRSDLLIVQ